MSKKLYYLTTEIVPFANVTSLADFSTRVPLALQEKGHDIRTIIPKYGYGKKIYFEGGHKVERDTI